jgi:hypothetical protein
MLSILKKGLFTQFVCSLDNRWRHLFILFEEITSEWVLLFYVEKKIPQIFFGSSIHLPHFYGRIRDIRK